MSIYGPPPQYFYAHIPALTLSCSLTHPHSVSDWIQSSMSIHAFMCVHSCVHVYVCTCTYVCVCVACKHIHAVLYGGNQPRPNAVHTGSRVVWGREKGPVGTCAEFSTISIFHWQCFVLGHFQSIYIYTRYAPDNSLGI